MNLPDNIDPRKLEDQILQRELEAMARRGGLRFSPWAKDGRPIGRPPEGWTLQSFSEVVTKHTPSTPEFLGAQAPMGWLKQATEAINGAEGYRSRAYHGALSSQRKPGKIDVTPGDIVGPEEVAVGYGFNMTQADGRKLYEAALKGQDAPAFDDVLNGRSTITQQQASALREHMILQKNRTLDRMLDGTPVRDHQRAALVSMLYQGANVKPVVQAIKDGKSDKDVADLIRATTLGPKNKAGRHVFAIRRDHEASLFMGAQAETYFAGVNSNALPVE